MIPISSSDHWHRFLESGSVAFFPAAALTMKHVIYFSHDCSDASVRRRVRMLQAAGADVSLIGFRRTDEPLTEVAGVKPIDLGRTHPGRFPHRFAKMLRSYANLRRVLRNLPEPSAVLGRTVEMMPLAAKCQRYFRGRPTLIYESLDIHRLLLSSSWTGRFLQKLERFYVERADLVLTSSPGFIREYFRPRFGPNVPIRLVENKVLQLDALAEVDRAGKTGNREQTQWTIGWFGALRCAESLRVLTALATALAGRVKVIVRGFPAPSVFGDLETQLKDVPNVRFYGRYRNPEDLKQIYAEVDFVWAIDMFETGANSKWLLPNRLYEGGCFAAVPLAQADTEVGRWVEEHGAGVQFSSPLLSNLRIFFEALDQERFELLANAVASLPAETWVDRAAECDALLAAMVTKRPRFPA